MKYVLVLMLVNHLVLGQTAEQLVQQQLDAYNQHDLKSFLAPYSDSVRVYNFPNRFLFDGKELMISQYEPMFKTLPELNVKIVNRQVLGNVVIDHELVHLGSFQDDFEVLVLYKIRYGKIQEVWFISPD